MDDSKSENVSDELSEVSEDTKMFRRQKAKDMMEKLKYLKALEKIKIDDSEID